MEHEGVLKSMLNKFWEIEEHIGTIERSGGYTKELNRVRYGNKPAVLDIRAWTENGSGEKICCKGITLSLEGARKLSEILQTYLETAEEKEEEKPERPSLLRRLPNRAAAADPEEDEPDKMEKWREEMGEELEKMYAE